MNELKILVEGYAYSGKNGNYFASPTTSLIITDNKKMLIDPGTNSKKLLEALSANNLRVADIDMVFLTHYHPDHFLNLRLFGAIDLYDGTMQWKEDEEITYTTPNVIPETDIQIIQTPGHTLEHCSLFFTDKNLGKVCIAQDVFWWEVGKQDTSSVDALMNLVDPFAVSTEKLNDSRKKILAIADWIVPGHGKMFKNPATF